MFFILFFWVVWLLDAPCLTWHVYAVVGAALFQALLSPWKEICIWLYFFGGEGLPKKDGQWKFALLWMPVETSSLLAGLWRIYGCSVVPKGMSPVWSWEPCVLLSAPCWPLLWPWADHCPSLGLSAFTASWRCWYEWLLRFSKSLEKVDRVSFRPYLGECPYLHISTLRNAGPVNIVLHWGVVSLFLSHDTQN